jgi:fermentation-respiration switch protein FrsA (DUF1100 family)
VQPETLLRLPHLSTPFAAAAGNTTSISNESTAWICRTARNSGSVQHAILERIVLWGESLGSGVAVALGAGQRVGRIVLEGSFTSAADVGAAHAYRFLPVRLLMKDQFRSDLRIARVTAPLLFLHGGRDWVVPIALGERLYALANEPNQFVRFSDAGHEEVDMYGAQNAVQAFLVSPSPEAPHGSKPDTVFMV